MTTPTAPAPGLSKALEDWRDALLHVSKTAQAIGAAPGLVPHDEIPPEVIECWRINYGLDKRSPAEAAAWWQDKCGMAPPGAVAALGMLLQERDKDAAEIQRLREELQLCREPTGAAK